MGIFKRVQEKDPIAKTQFSLLAAGVMTGLIALVWVSTLPARIGDTISVDKQQRANEESEESEGGLNSLIGETKNQLGSLMEWKEKLESETSPESDPAEDSILDEVPTENTSSLALESLSVATTSEATSTPIESAPLLATSTPIEVVPVEPAPPPKIILIGTTTSQKPE
ncbi:hypothetical protein IPH92_02290 [Candidatus Kaiserbacteria bacterium]|nr:MAG: hypothetical protein IPH92_02290 [Candidatus Kaiserbacteria bacterium]